MTKQTLFSIFGVILALVVGLGAGEVVIRVKNSSMTNYDIEMWRYARSLKMRSDDPALGHEHIANASAVLQSVPLRINADGLRGGPVPAALPGQRRILFLGSSITLGWGVAEENTLTALVEKGLADKGQPAVVMNGGIGNYNAQRYVRRFLSKLAGLAPTDIVVQAFVRDGEVLESGDSSWILRNSQLAMTIWTAAHRVFDRTGPDALVDHYRKAYEPGSKGRADLDAALDQLAAYAKANNIRLYMLMTPDVHDLKSYRLGFVHDVFKEIAARDGYGYLDVLPYFGQLSPEQLWAMPGDPHPNALGHQLMAKAALDLLAGK